MSRAQILDSDGQPIKAKPEIPFIQWLPDGTSKGRYINRGYEVYAQACRFIARGGRYAFVVRRMGEGDDVGELVAGFPVKGGAKGEMIMVAEERVPDGPAIGPAVDRLVIASVANMALAQTTPVLQ